MLWIDYIVLVLALLLIGIVLLQDSKDDIKDAFSGERSDLFKVQKQRGFDKVLMIATAVIGVLFVVCAMLAGVEDIFPR